jgi:hypothetical protein
MTKKEQKNASFQGVIKGAFVFQKSIKIGNNY